LGWSLTAKAASATWIGGTSTLWSNSANWSPAAVPNATTDVATFDTVASLTGLGGIPITIATLTTSTNVTIADTASADTLTFNSTTDPINVSAGATLTLNLYTVFAAATTIGGIPSGAILNFGSAANTNTLLLPNGLVTINTGGTINVLAKDTVDGGGSSSGILLNGGVTVNLGGPAWGGTVTNNTIEVENRINFEHSD